MNKLPRIGPDHHYDDEQELMEKIAEYFESRIAHRYHWTGRIKDGEKVMEREEYMRPPTMAGMARHLGIGRRTLADYRTGDRHGHIIQAAKDRIAEWWEEGLAYRETAGGAQFALRVIHGYEDDQGETGEPYQNNTIPPADTKQEAIPVFSPGDQND